MASELHLSLKTIVMTPRGEKLSLPCLCVCALQVILALFRSIPLLYPLLFLAQAVGLNVHLSAPCTNWLALRIQNDEPH